MAQSTIRQMVYDRLPFLNLGNAAITEALIDRLANECYWELQPQSKKDDVAVELEAEYTPQQRIFFAYYTAYKLLNQRVMIQMGGTTGTAAAGNSVLKKAVVDVLEVEFDALKSSDIAFGINTLELLNMAQRDVCMQAYNVSWSLPICGFNTIAPPVPIFTNYPRAFYIP